MNYQKNTIRVNHRIRATEVRVIDENGGQVGVLPTGAALKMASERGLDLVEIAPEAKPPVCRIVDFGKFRYEQAKKHKGDTKNTAASKLKELKFHVNTGPNDYSIKINHAIGFLTKGMRVKMSIFFRGRELHRQEFGLQLIRRIVEELGPHGHTDTEPRLLGKNLHVILVPGKAKPRFTSEAPAHVPVPAPQTTSTTNSFGTTIKIDLKPSTSGSK